MPHDMKNDLINVIVFTDSFRETSGVGTYHRTLMDWCARQDYVAMTVVCPDPAGGQDFEVSEHVVAIRPRFQL